MTSQDDLPGASPEPVPPLPPEPPPAPVAAAPATISPRLEATLQQFASDYMRDRRSERRWKLTFRVLWVLVIVMFLWSGLAARKAANMPNGPHTALVEVRGEIASDTEASAERIVSALKSAFEDVFGPAAVPAAALARKAG